MIPEAVNGRIPVGKIPRVYDVDDEVVWFQVDGRYYGFPRGIVALENGAVYQMADEVAVRAALEGRQHTHETAEHPVDVRLTS